MGVKAAVMIKPGEIEIRSFPLPEISEDEALIKMELSGICGTDKNVYQGNITHPGGIVTPFPIIPGHENVGVISEIGDAASAEMEARGYPLKKGDRVVPMCDVPISKNNICNFIYGYLGWCKKIIGYGTTISCDTPPHLFGGWSEYMYIHPNTPLFKVPNNLPPQAAVLTEPFAVAYGSLIKAMQPTSPVLDIHGFSPGDDVVILGPGPLGLIHAIISRIVGAGDIIMVGSGSENDEWRLNYIFKNFNMVVDHVINDPKPDNRLKEIWYLTGNRGADLVIECAGVPNAIVQGLKILREKGGTLLSVGVFIDTGKTIEINPAKYITHKNVRIIGITNHPLQGYDRALKLMRKYISKIPLTKIITHTFPLSEVRKAMETAIKGKGIKVVIAPGESS